MRRAQKAALCTVVVATSATLTSAQWGYGYPGYGTYGYGLRPVTYGYGGYYGGYARGGYGGYGYPSFYYGRRRLSQAAEAGAAPAECPLAADTATFEAAAAAAAEQCTPEAALAVDKTLFCAQCVAPGQRALAKLTYAFVEKAEQDAGGDRAAAQEALSGLLSPSAEAACGRALIEVYNRTLEVDPAFMAKAVHCGGIADRPSCPAAADSLELAAAADACAAALPNDDNDAAACTDCYWPLFGFALEQALTTTTDEKLLCAVQQLESAKEAGELGADLTPEQEFLSDEIYTDDVFVSCFTAGVAAVLNRTQLIAEAESGTPSQPAPGGPPPEDPLRRLASTCWKPENRLPPGSLISDAAKDAVKAKAC